MRCKNWSAISLQIIKKSPASIAADKGVPLFLAPAKQQHRRKYSASLLDTSDAADGERDGNPGDADAVLARNKEWHDTSEYHVS